MELCGIDLKMSFQGTTLVLLTLLPVFSGLHTYGKDICSEPAIAKGSFNIPDKCAKLNFTNKCDSVAVTRKCQDDDTKYSAIEHSIQCNINTTLKATPYYTPGQTLIKDNTFFVCKANGDLDEVSSPNCTVYDCGDFGKVANGENWMEIVRVAKNEYTSKIKVTCNTGYVLNGWPLIECTNTKTLKWSASKPKCIPSTCGNLPGQTSPCLQEISITKSDGRVEAAFICLEGNDVNISVTPISGSKTSTESSFCNDQSVSWSKGIGCYCNCLVPADFSKVKATNLINRKFLKHGDVLKWDCVEGYTKPFNRTFKCNDKSLISIDYPSEESRNLSSSFKKAQFLHCVKAESVNSHSSTQKPGPWKFVLGNWIIITFLFLLKFAQL